LLAAIGYGKFSARSILARLVPADEAQSFSGHAPAHTTDEGSTAQRLHQRRAARLRRRQLGHQGQGTTTT
jgi:hypothetical protein